MDSKVCTKCKQTKPVSEFYAGKKGVRFHCKECEKSASKSYYYNNTDKVIARVDQYRKENGRKKKPSTPEQVRAYQAVRMALADGTLVKPDKCELCRKVNHLHGHHWNGYSNPLDVVWLCPTCHHSVHGRGQHKVELVSVLYILRNMQVQASAVMYGEIGNE